MNKDDFIITQEEYEKIGKRNKYKIEYRKNRIIQINGIRIYDVYQENIFKKRFKILGIKYDFERTAFFVYMDNIRDNKIKKLKVCTFIKKHKEGTYSKI